MADRPPGCGRPSRATPASADTGSQPPDLSETVAINKGLETNSDVNAPTIITVDAANTTPPVVRQSAIDATVYEPAKPAPPPPKPAMPDATVVESASMASSMTAPQVVKPAPQVVTASPASKSKAGLFIGVAVVLLVILGAGVGGFLLWNSSKSKPGTNSSNANTSNAVVTAPKEVSRYWLELERAAAGAQTTRVAGLVPIASGQSFKFHFTFTEDGYLYIFGPGDNNQPTAFYCLQ